MRRHRHHGDHRRGMGSANLGEVLCICGFHHDDMHVVMASCMTTCMTTWHHACRHGGCFFVWEFFKLIL
ncbi:CLUMA_CG006443, isoform A [Clunio marinus]|uniref:CLUMA_CG006443, isoform A n=1 Tax=Clunio marinus TaxID=568069 RepID=A0A1J1HXM7_9DIPT|nr:CLUMA_CG006443, isoform A [Clunio marinus]